MPRISDIEDTTNHRLDLPALPWFQKAMEGGLAAGSTNIISGHPGAGKSTLVAQTLGALAKQGVRSLYIPTEQSFDEVKRIFTRVVGPDVPGNIFIESIGDLTALPQLLQQKILSPSGEFYGCQVIAIDSLQGGGLMGTGGPVFQALQNYIETAKAAGTISFFVNHVTKTGDMAGPKALEHTVDTVLYLRTTFNLIPLFVPKNRFGPTSRDPIILVMTDEGLVESPHVSFEASSVLGYLGGNELSEAQASITIPRYGSHPSLNAPFLPAKKIQLLLKVLGTLEGVSIADLSYDINCYLPGSGGYDSVLDLPIAVAFLSSYTQRPVKEGSLFVGEVDLTRQIRAPSKTEYLKGLAQMILRNQPEKISRVYLAIQAADELANMKLDPGGKTVREVVEVRGVRDLDDLVNAIWFSPTSKYNLPEKESDMHDGASLFA
jgi:DNA repair protein RadA/Sms